MIWSTCQIFQVFFVNMTNRTYPCDLSLTGSGCNTYRITAGPEIHQYCLIASSVSSRASPISFMTTL